MPQYEVIIDYTASSVWTVEAENEDAAITIGEEMEDALSDEERQERLAQTLERRSESWTWAVETPEMPQEVTNA